MDTPIADFVARYAASDALRFHMPGHKGAGATERFDITEIAGADSLYEADGIIAESERNASRLFGAHTFYSAEGSSLAIRAMLYLVSLYAAKKGEKPYILAGRNAHKTLISAVALLDTDLDFIGADGGSYLSCRISAEDVRRRLVGTERLPTAVYLTSPDYLGNMADVRRIADVCHAYGVLLFVDNAHGAYLKFLPQSRHPIDLGADVCCDSAHKTFPVLTGGAYLHIAHTAPAVFKERARDALALFGSTSPSYLILASLDRANAYLADGYPVRLSAFLSELSALRHTLSEHGYTLVGDEPMKLTLKAKPYGYLGTEIAEYLIEKGIVPEFSDPDYLVLMPSPSLPSDATERIADALLSLPHRAAVSDEPPAPSLPERVMPIRAALLADSERLPVTRAASRILAAVNVGCPPAVPIVVSGERIDEAAVRALLYYGITECTVVKE